MEKSHSLNSPMVVYSLKINKYMFHPKEENEKVFNSKIPYPNTINTFMYLSNYT